MLTTEGIYPRILFADEPIAILADMRCETISTVLSIFSIFTILTIFTVCAILPVYTFRLYSRIFFADKPVSILANVRCYTVFTV